jgi:hypothetical protein
MIIIVVHQDGIMMMVPASYAGLLLLSFSWLSCSCSCALEVVVTSWVLLPLPAAKNIKLFWHLEVHRHHDYANLEKIEHKKSKNTLGSHPEYVWRMVGDIK